MNPRLEGGEYLIRFDDICPTMPWSLWNEIERVLIAHEVRPILAVVPDNRDPELQCEAPDPNFWDRVRGWQERGWTIGLHGYQHVYVTHSPGLIGLNNYSEFAGLPYSEQHRKLAAALEIFDREKVRADLWVAPAHTFDHETLKALRALNITDISDGFGLRPHTDRNGMFWIPAQLGNFHLLPAGVWTVAIHISDPAHADVHRLDRNLGRLRGMITDVGRVKSRYGTNRDLMLSRAWAGTFRWSKRLLRTGLSLADAI